MYLTKTGVLDSKLIIDISFEQVADDLLLVRIVNRAQQGIPSYWRLTNAVDIPPLELGVDCQEGYISDITVFVDGLDIKDGEKINTPLPKLFGNVLVDTSIFKKVFDIVDVNDTFDVYIYKDKLICLFEKTKEITETVKVDRVEMYIDCSEQIVGFAICDLTETEIYLLNIIKK
jgi:hypothetical protein